MASVDGIRIDCSTDGAVFELSSPSDVDFSLTDGGSTVRLTRGSPALIVEVASGSTLPADVHTAAFAMAQKTLDLVAIRTGRFYSTPSADIDHILWWGSLTAGVTLRITSCLPVSMTIDLAWTVSRADGTEERSSDIPPPTWHESFRYLRAAQVTDNLYDAYRTAYLALESLLSQYHPRQPREGDKAWNRRALGELEAAGLDLSQFVSRPTGDSVEDFLREQYVALRCAHDHAKLSEPHFLPATLNDRVLVQNALYDLTRFLQAAMLQLIGSTVSAGVTTFAGIKHYNDVLAHRTLHVSSDPTPEKPADTEVSPLGLPVTDLSTTYLGAVDTDGYDYGWLGTVTAADLAEPIIRTIASRVDDVLYSRGTVLAVDTSGITTLEYLQIQYWSGNGGIRRHYRL